MTKSSFESTGSLPLVDRRSRKVATSMVGHDVRGEQLWSERERQALKAPGAYEWWYFQAISPAGDGVVFAMFQGLPFHPHYLTQLNRPLRSARVQTGRSEGTSKQYPAAYLAVYEGGKKTAQFLNMYPAEPVSGNSSEIRIGPNRVTFRRDGSIGIVAKGYPFDVSRGRVRQRTDQVLSAELTMTPTFASEGYTRPFRAPSANGAAHQWHLTAPHGRMTGRVQLLDKQEQSIQTELSVSAIAYHDHVYGHASLAAGVHKQYWGFLQGEDWAAVWQHTLSKEMPGGQTTGLVLFEAGEKPVVIEGPVLTLGPLQVGRWLLRYPSTVAMHGSDTQGHSAECLITHKGLLDTAPFHTCLAASGSLVIPGRGSYVGTGATHLLQLRRLKWPILSDVTLLATTLVPADDPLWRQ